MHKTVLLKKYRFFDIGNDNFYFDFDGTDAQTEIDDKNYIRPLLETLLSLTKELGDKFKCSLTTSGIVFENFERAAPELLDMMKELYETGCIEFTGMPYYHSLASLTDKEEFEKQVKLHSDKLRKIFGVRPTTFRNTELIYSDEIGKTIYDMGFDTVLTEGCGKAVELAGTNVLYFNPIKERLKILTRNQDYSRMFQDALKDTKIFTPEYFAQKFYDFDEEDQVVYLGINFNNFNKANVDSKDLLKFFDGFTHSVLATGEFDFETPSEVSKNFKAENPLNCPNLVSGMNRYHDLTPWQSNELQQEALQKITSFSKLVSLAGSDALTEIWRRLQSSDYFYYMSTEYFNNPAYGYKPNPFKSPYEAFINYMNIISDLERRLNLKIQEIERNKLSNQEIMEIISHYEKIIVSLKQKLEEREE
jgi:alpha-amylase